MYYPDTNNMSNAIVATFSTIPAWLMAFITQSPDSAVWSLVLPLVFFILGKLIDVGIKLLIEKTKNENKGIRGDTER